MAKLYLGQVSLIFSFTKDLPSLHILPPFLPSFLSSILPSSLSSRHPFVYSLIHPSFLPSRIQSITKKCILLSSYPHITASFLQSIHLSIILPSNWCILAAHHSSRIFVFILFHLNNNLQQALQICLLRHTNIC